MELNSTTEVNTEFFKLFLSKATSKAFAGENCPFIEVPKGAGTVDVLVRYYNRGGATGVTELPEKYPCLVIQDYPPEFDAARVRVKDWIENTVNTTTKKVQVIKFPMPLTFRYQVSLFSTSKSDHDAITDYMFRTFGAGSINGCFMLKPVATDNIGELGIPVPYRSSVATIDREDNRFEWAVDYTLFPFVHLQPAEWKDYIEEIKLVLESFDPSGAEYVEEILLTVQ